MSARRPSDPVHTGNLFSALAAEFPENHLTAG